MEIHSVLSTTVSSDRQVHLDSNPVAGNIQNEPKSSLGLGLKIANTSLRLASLAAITMFSPELGVALMGLLIVEPKRIL